MQPSQALNQMRQTMFQQVGMTDAAWELVAPYVKVIHKGKKQLLQRAGEAVEYHYYVADGLVRWYYTTIEGKELNKGFYGSSNIVGSLTAVILNEPARFSVETLEPCTLVELPLSQVNKLYETSEYWQKLFNYSCQRMMVRNERREAELLTLSSKQRFLQFQRNFADYIDYIPQYHVASYLGITPVALSKYKRQWLESEAQDS